MGKLLALNISIGNKTWKSLKINRIFLGILIFLVCFIPEVRSQGEEPYLDITSPTADTVWYVGDVVTISWETNIEVATVNISIWSLSEQEIYGKVAINDGLYSFTLSLETPTGMDYSVEIDIEGISSELSQNFTISTKPPLDYTIWIMLGSGLGILGIFLTSFYFIRQNRNKKKKIKSK